jgi:hypothetical protein
MSDGAGVGIEGIREKRRRIEWGGHWRRRGGGRKDDVGEDGNVSLGGGVHNVRAALGPDVTFFDVFDWPTAGPLELKPTGS